MKEKHCFKCNETKTIDDFYKNRTRKDGLHGNCKSCQKYYCWANTLVKNYGITEEDYNRLFLEQEGCCAICGRHQIEFQRTLALDHSHKTGIIRGILCPPCNTRLGKYDDNPEFLRATADELDSQTPELLRASADYLENETNEAFMDIPLTPYYTAIMLKSLLDE